MISGALVQLFACVDVSVTPWDFFWQQNTESF